MRGGFTLIELAVVLVIIGLIAGGVLIGQDLIEAARLRGQITQIEKFNAATNTFKMKYGGIPGDLRADQAQVYGFTARSGAASHGDGNGTLEACDITGVITSDRYLGCETALFWSDLSMAGLIPGEFTTATDDYVSLMMDNQAQYVPAAAIGGQVAVFSNALMDVFTLEQAYSCQDKFCFALVNDMMTLNDGRIVMKAGITPLQAYSIDSKTDDGLPSTGDVLGGPPDFANGSGVSLYYIPNIISQRCREDGGNYNLDATQGILKQCIMNFGYQ